MIQIPGYNISGILTQDPPYTYYRALRIDKGHPVILKTHTDCAPGDMVSGGLEREYTVLRRFGFRFALNPLSAIRFPGHVALAFEDWNGAVLREIIADSKPGILFGLKVSMLVAEALQELHDKNLVHQRVSPTSIMVDRNGEAIKLLAFESALDLETGSPGAPVSPVRFGLTGYSAPEQFGRMNMAPDSRSDLYSLGICLFELLTGAPPFDSSDPLELMHSHMARTPAPLNQVDPTLPGPVCEIVARLLSKNANDRYQSALGVHEDLKTIVSGLERSQEINGVTLGVADSIGHFRIPDGFYGRRDLLDLLNAQFDNCAQGSKEIGLLSGEAGVGKTRLVSHFGRSARLKNARFVRGKFKQFSGNVPYSGIMEAFGQLCRRILSQTDSELAWKREVIRSRLGENAGLLSKALPELEMIIGPQPDVRETGPEENQNRFLHLVNSFVAALAETEKPLIIFMDDLQWADTGSLKLIETLARNDQIGSFMILAAYRNENMPPDSPPARTILSVKTNVKRVTELSLQALNMDEVFEMVKGTFPSDTNSLDKLTGLIYSRSAGNPFFVKELLRTIHQRGLARFNRDDNTWKYDINAIQAQAFSEDIVELIVSKIKTMPPDIQDFLKVSSCVAAAFDADLMAGVLGLDQTEVHRLIDKAMIEDFVARVSKPDKSVGKDTRPSSPDHEDSPMWQLIHDRVQQAAYLLVNDREKESIHRRIGERLLLRMNDSNRSRLLFDVVSQFNLSVRSHKDSMIDHDLARLNLEAGARAHNSAAYETADSYLTKGLSMLGPSVWQEDYELAMGLHLQGAEEAFLCADFDRMDQLLSKVLENSASLIEKIKAHEIRIQALVAQGRNAEAVNTALPLLGQLGVKLPHSPSRAQVLVSFLRTRLALRRVKIEELIDLPEMTDPELISAMRILARLASAAYVTLPELVPVIAFKMVRLSLNHGNTPATAYAYTGCGLIFCQVFGNIETGYKFGELALKLVEKFNARELKALTTFSVNCFIKHWKKPVSQTLDPLEKAFETGIETGDLEAATASAFIHSRYAFFSGKPLNELDPEMGRFDKIIENSGQVSFLNAHRSTWQTVKNLIHCKDEPWTLVGDVYDEFEMIHNHHRDKDYRALLLLHFNKLFLLLLFNKYDEAARHGLIGCEYLDKGRSTYTIPLFHFYRGLALVKNESLNNRSQGVPGTVKRGLKSLRLWAKHCPENHLRRKLILEAELARTKGKPLAAEQFYEEAIKENGTHGPIQEIALAHEMAGEFYLERNRSFIARAFFEEAIERYKSWGAQTKADQLVSRHEKTLKKFGVSAPRDSESAGHGRKEESLDFVAALEASQAISGEIRIEKLIETLMRLALALGGAQKAFLIMNTGEKLRVEAGVRLGEERGVSFEPVDLEQCQDISRSIVNYVARTRERITLDNASGQGFFVNDPYIKKSGTRSALCAPIVHQGNLRAVLYLENNLVERAFTPEKIEVLHLICSQAAISMENARLYTEIRNHSKTLEKKVVERTKELKEINVKLIDEIRFRQETENALKESEKRFRDMAELLPQYVFEIDTEGYFLFLNRYGLEQIGHTEQDLDRGLNSLELFAPEDRVRALTNMNKVLAGESMEGNEYRFVTGGNHSFPAIIFSAPIRQDGQIVGVRGVAVDITDAKKAEEEIKAALAEKEVLLREIHHRVKNNLQIMTSLLSLQCRRATDRAVKAMLMDAHNRVTSMSLIHELLYESEGLAAINVRKFINRLTNQMAEAHGALATGVKIEREVDDLSFGVDIAIPLGFLVTELVSNAFKHAFPKGSPGVVRIALKAEGNRMCRLVVKDNGVGLEDISNSKERDSLGFRLLQIFAGQMDADLDIRSENGVECSVTFKVP